MDVVFFESLLIMFIFVKWCDWWIYLCMGETIQSPNDDCDVWPITDLTSVCHLRPLGAKREISACPKNRFNKSNQNSRRPSRTRNNSWKILKVLEFKSNSKNFPGKCVIMFLFLSKGCSSNDRDRSRIIKCNNRWRHGPSERKWIFRSVRRRVRTRMVMLCDSHVSLTPHIQPAKTRGDDH